MAYRWRRGAAPAGLGRPRAIGPSQACVFVRSLNKNRRRHGRLGGKAPTLHTRRRCPPPSAYVTRRSVEPSLVPTSPLRPSGSCNGLREVQMAGPKPGPRRQQRQGPCDEGVDDDDRDDDEHEHADGSQDPCLPVSPDTLIGAASASAPARAVVQRHRPDEDPRRRRLPGRVIPRPGRVGAAVQGVLPRRRLPHLGGGAQEGRGGAARGRRGAGPARRQEQCLA